MENELRQLQLSDLPQIEELLSEQDRLFRIPKKLDANKKYLSAIQYRLSQSPQYLVIYGFFINDKLMSIAGGLFGKKMSLWTLCYMHARQSDSHTYRQTTGRVVDAMITEAENRGIYRFDYATAIRPINYQPEKHFSRLSRFSEKAKRYEYFTEAFIPKNTIPPYEYQWWLLGEHVQEVDMVIRTAELKEEFRTGIVEKIREAIQEAQFFKPEESFLPGDGHRG